MNCPNRQIGAMLAYAWSGRIMASLFTIRLNLDHVTAIIPARRPGSGLSVGVETAGDRGAGVETGHGRRR